MLTNHLAKHVGCKNYYYALTRAHMLMMFYLATLSTSSPASHGGPVFRNSTATWRKYWCHDATRQRLLTSNRRDVQHCGRPRVSLLVLIRLMHDFSRERQPLYCDVIIGKQIILIKLDRVSCTNYFMSIHNLRYNVQLIIIATRNKEIFEKNPRF